MYQRLIPDVRPQHEIALAHAEARIACALNRPHPRAWLKAARRTTAELDPIAVEMKIELLGQLIVERAGAEPNVASTT